jgi:hypothetical protein
MPNVHAATLVSTSGSSASFIPSEGEMRRSSTPPSSSGPPAAALTEIYGDLPKYSDASIVGPLSSTQFPIPPYLSLSPFPGSILRGPQAVEERDASSPIPLTSDQTCPSEGSHPPCALPQDFEADAMEISGPEQLPSPPFHQSDEASVEEQESYGTIMKVISPAHLSHAFQAWSPPTLQPAKDWSSQGSGSNASEWEQPEQSEESVDMSPWVPTSWKLHKIYRQRVRPRHLVTSQQAFFYLESGKPGPPLPGWYMEDDEVILTDQKATMETLPSQNMAIDEDAYVNPGYSRNQQPIPSRQASVTSMVTSRKAMKHTPKSVKRWKIPSYYPAPNPDPGIWKGCRCTNLWLEDREDHEATCKRFGSRPFLVFEKYAPGKLEDLIACHDLLDMFMRVHREGSGDQERIHVQEMTAHGSESEMAEEDVAETSEGDL